MSLPEVLLWRALRAITAIAAAANLRKALLSASRPWV